MAKHVDLSLLEKVKLVRELELPCQTQASIAKKFGVSKLQVSRLSTKKRELLHAFESGGNHGRKRRRGIKEHVGRTLFF